MNQPVKTKCWVKFLESRGCVFKSIKESHHKWKCPNCLRSIIFRGANKEIPFIHIKTNLATLGVSVQEFEEWIKSNC